MKALKENVAIRNVSEADAEAITGIYNHYITETIVTFEEEAVSPAEIRRRILAAQSASRPWFVAGLGDEILGYAYGTGWKERRAYRYSVEVTVYVRPGHAGHGVGSKLYHRLLTALKDLGYHAAMGGIALPNEASIALHEKFGFTKTAHFKEVGFKFNRWIDVGYWQLIL